MVQRRLHHSYILILMLSISSALFGCQPQDQLRAQGTLERDRISLTAPSAEIITQLAAREGDKVKAGDLLLQLDTRKQKAKLAQAIAAKHKAEVYLKQMLNGERAQDIAAAKANYESLQAKLIDAKKNYQRILSLSQKNLASKSARDSAKAEQDAAQADYQAALQNWQKLNQGYRVEEIEQAQADLAAQEANLALEQAVLDELSIRATRDARLDSLPYHQGERVSAGSIVAILQADSAPYARVYIPEPALAHFSIGQSYPVYIDGVASPLQAKVRWYSREPSFTPYRNMSEEDRARLVYLAELALPRSANEFAVGVPLYVDLTQATNASDSRD